MQRRIRVLTTIGAVLAVAALGAQDVPGPRQGGRGRGFPPRDAQPQPTGSSRVGGRVTTLDGTPVRRAQVSLASRDAGVRRGATTDNDGLFEFADLPAGRYTLSAGKTGYLTLNYGQRRPFEPGTPIDLADKQTIGRADVILPRGSVITGTLSDEFGEPMPDATVQALRYRYVGGRRQLTPTGRTAQTNDIGQFRIFGLPPGDYFVASTLRAAGPLAQILADNIEVFLPAGGDAIRFQGAGGPAMLAGRMVGLGGLGQDGASGYAPTYYPGAADVAAAQRITVGLGEEISGISFGMLAVPLARISGTAIDSQGAPLDRARVMLESTAGAPIDPSAGGAVFDGRFEMAGVPPGEYTLRVQTVGRGRGRGGDLEFARVPVFVNGADVDGLILATSPGATVAGRVVSSGTAIPGGSRLRVTVVSVDAEPIATPGGFVDDGGAFELRGLAGTYLFRAANLPAGWSLKRVTLAGQDVTDTPYPIFGGTDIDDLEVEVTDKSTRITGVVTDNQGRPVEDYAVIVFAADSTLWAPPSRFVRAGRPDQDGRFEISSLPPGQYLAVAVEYLEQGSEADPDLLEQLVGGASSFTLDEGEMTQLTLVGRWGR
jgi:protocatechuate 3,4-dioxygenase beta subunit